MIRAEGLTKDFGNRRAIDNLTFDARKGEIVGFLGPNGAGKTTTMRILCGYMPPTYGKAEVAGHDVIDASLDVRKKVGYMPETVPLYPDMTVFEYLKYMADLRRVPDAEERVDEILERFGLEDRADGYIANLSKGMRQRVGLAQALVHQPEVLILDEPTIGLDPVQIIEVRNLIRELGAEHTVLLSTHILSEAQQLCNRVMIINKGKIVAEDTTEMLQSRLSGAKMVTVRVSGDSDGLESVIGKVPGVARVIKLEEGKVEFETEPSRDSSPDVARAVVNGGFSLVEFRPAGLSLEDIFIQLTRDEPIHPNMAAAESSEAETDDEPE